MLYTWQAKSALGRLNSREGFFTGSVVRSPFRGPVRSAEPEPMTVTVMQQRGDMDCGVVCVAMFCDVSYETALAELAIVTKTNILNHGAYLKEMQEACKRLGFRTQRKAKGKYDPFHSEGILNVEGLGYGHVVYLYYGVVVDPSHGQLYRFNEYFAGKVRPGTLIVEHDRRT